MRSSSQFTKLAGFAFIIVLFVAGSLHSSSVQADYAAQATMEGTVASVTGPTATQEPCPPAIDTSAMMSATPQSAASAANASSASGAPGFLGVEIAAVDNCAVHVLQVFSGSSAANVLQPGDVIGAVDCVALTDLTSNSVATAAAGSSAPANCMSAGVAPANPPAAMGGVIGSLSDPACMNTGVAGGTLRVTTLFFCIIGHYHAGDTITLTLWRTNQQMNVSVVLDTVPPGPAPTQVATEGGVAPTTASSGATATPIPTEAATTVPTDAGTPAPTP